MERDERVVARNQTVEALCNGRGFGVLGVGGLDRAPEFLGVGSEAVRRLLVGLEARVDRVAFGLRERLETFVLSEPRVVRLDELGRLASCCGQEPLALVGKVRRSNDPCLW